jgi:hypothetical protein
MNGEQTRICKEAVVACLKVLSSHSPGEIEINHKTPSNDSILISRDLNQVPPEYKSKALPLHELAGRNAKVHELDSFLTAVWEVTLRLRWEKHVTRMGKQNMHI